MTDRKFTKLKSIAKRLARARRIPHHKALDLVASTCGHPHWNALTVAWSNQWRPTEEQMKLLDEPQDANSEQRGVGFAEESKGLAAGHEYELSIGFDGVLVGGRGWAIHLGHAPSEPPSIEKYVTPNPLDDAAFLAEMLDIANGAADKVREAIARDWPRRSTKPDSEGRAAHPLFRGVSAEWRCLHCDGEFTGSQMAENMWHCPKCSATPLDIFAEPFWKVA